MKINLIAVFGALVILLVTGCQTFSGKSSDTLTSVTITNQSVSAVTQATAAVFAGHGFTGGQSGSGQYTYHRPGTRSENFAYGNAMFDETVTVQVQVNINRLDDHTVYVGCNAWLIDAANDPVAEDSHQVRPMGKWPYEKILKEIKKQFGQ